MSRTRLLILDDHNLFRESLGRFLAMEPDLEVVGNCSTSKDALDLLRTSPIDLVLLDFLGMSVLGVLVRAAAAVNPSA